MSDAAAQPGNGSLRERGQVPSILILTKDEEINIERCLKRLTWADDVVVFDSYSKDRTVELARSFPNVRVVQREFDTEWKHRNAALHEVGYRNDWVYVCDADERVTPELRDEMVHTINDNSVEHVAYRLRFRNMFFGRWLRKGGVYPVWIIRLVRPDRVRYERRETNVHPIVDGSLGDLTHHFDHHTFNKGLEAWFTKHNSYSSMEATEAARIVEGSMFAQLKGVLASKDPQARRRAFKNLSFYIPWRELARFFYMLVPRLGILDRRAGLTYASMISMYEYWIELKLRENRRKPHGKTEKLADKVLGDPLPSSERAASPEPSEVVA